MDLQIILILLIIGFIAGMLGGIVGIGGGIIIVPSLVYFLGYTQQNAQGTSLGLIMLPVGILGFLQYYYSSQKAGTPINFYVIGILAVAFIMGSYFGSRIALTISQDLLKKCFAGLLLLIGFKMLFLDKSPPKKIQSSKVSNITI